MLAFIAASAAGAKDAKIEDFMPLHHEPQQQSEEEIMLRMNLMFQSMGGKMG